MTSVFVDKNSRIPVNVFVYEQNGDLVATGDRAKIGPTTDPKSIVTVSFMFRRPTYADSLKIMGEFTRSTPQTIDVSSMSEPDRRPIITMQPESALVIQDHLLRILLAEIVITDADGEKQTVKASEEVINSLHPVAVREAIVGLGGLTII